jgi:hypothetical protein
LIVLPTNHDNNPNKDATEPTRRLTFRSLLVDPPADLGAFTGAIFRDHSGKLTELKFQSKIR